MPAKRTALAADLCVAGAPAKHVSSGSWLLELPQEILFHILYGETNGLEFARMFCRLRRTCRTLCALFGSPAEIERAKCLAAVVHKEVFAETIHYTTMLPSGDFHGRCWGEWRSNKRIRFESTYRDDVQVGRTILYARDGTVESIKQRDAEGRFHGVQIEYDRHRSVQTNITFRHGVSHGPSREYHGGRLVEYCSYVEGVMEGAHRSWKREFRYGRLIVFMHETFRRGVLHGQRRWHWRLPDGRLVVASVRMVRGKEQGLCVERVAETNEIVSSVHFCNGKMVGRRREVVLLGGVVYRVTSVYVRGVLHGVRAFVQEGQVDVAREQLFRRGELVSDTYKLADNMRVTMWFGRQGEIVEQKLTRGPKHKVLFHQRFSGSSSMSPVLSGKHKWI